MRNRVIALGAALLLVALTQVASAAGPGLDVSAPKDGAAVQGDRVTLSFKVSDFNLVHTTVPLSEAGKHPEVNHPGEGHLHLMLDLQPLIVWETANDYVFTGVPPGQHDLMVELANNDHASLSPQVVRHIRFSTFMVLPQTGAGNSKWPGGIALGLGALLALLVLAGGVVLRQRRA